VSEEVLRWAIEKQHLEVIIILPTIDVIVNIDHYYLLHFAHVPSADSYL